MLLVPGEEAAFADNRPVPHGEIRLVWYPRSGERSWAAHWPACGDYEMAPRAAKVLRSIDTLKQSGP